MGLLPTQMNLDEMQQLPLCARNILRYIEIRNHIVKVWLENKTHYLSRDEYAANIKVPLCACAICYALYSLFADA